MSKGNYGYYQKVHKILFMPSSIMFMLKCNSIYYHREHKKRLLPISNYDFTLMLISDLIKIYVKVGSPSQSHKGLLTAHQISLGNHECHSCIIKCHFYKTLSICLPAKAAKKRYFQKQASALYCRNNY